MSLAIRQRPPAIREESFREPFPFELYLPAEAAGPFPLICVTPILGRLVFFEDLFWERRFARFFAQRGFASALVNRPFFELDPARGVEQIEEYLVASVERNKKVLDFLIDQKEIAPERIGSFGISFGAVVNLLWASRDPRLKAHVFALAGGNLPEIFLTSRDPLMRGYLKAILQGLGFEKSALKEALRKTLHVDPLKVSSSIPKEKVFLLLALFDRVIRFRYGLALWRALGKPPTLFLPLGHYTTLVAVPLLKGRVLRFFRKKL